MPNDDADETLRELNPSGRVPVAGQRDLEAKRKPPPPRAPMTQTQFTKAGTDPRLKNQEALAKLLRDR